MIQGLNPRTKDERDIRVGGLFKSLPDISKIPDFFIEGGFEVLPQTDDECSAYMSCGISELQEKIELDRAYHFALSKSQDDNVDSFGTDIKNSLSVSVKVGDLPRYKRPINLESAPLSVLRRLENWGAGFYDICAKQKKKGYVWVDSFEEAISIMWYYYQRGQKCAVGFGTYFDLPLQTIFWEGKWKKEEGGHAMFMRGLKTIQGKKYIIVQNSYGKYAGQLGVHYFDKERIDASLDTFNGAFFIDYTPEELRKMLERGNTVDTGWLLNAMNSLIKTLIKIWKPQIGRIPSLYDTAYSLLGKHLTMDLDVPKEVGCGQALSYVLKRYGMNIPKNGISGTIGINKWLSENATQIPKSEAMEGDIIVSITEGDNHGHCGVMGYRSIMSNNSLTGKWSCDWNLDKWLDYYQSKKGLTTKYYRV